MDLQKLASVAEISSAVAILITLVYLAIQTNQNTEAIQANTRQAMISADQELLNVIIESPELDEYYSELQHRLGTEFDEVSAKAMATLTDYDWPGNVRELKNIIERAMILSRGSVLQLGDWFSSQHEVKVVSFQPDERAGETIEEVERAHIEKVLAACDWKIRGKDGAAEHLGLKRTTLQSRMKKLGIERPRA